MTLSKLIYALDALYLLDVDIIWVGLSSLRPLLKRIEKSTRKIFTHYVLALQQHLWHGRVSRCKVCSHMTSCKLISEHAATRDENTTTNVGFLIRQLRTLKLRHSRTKASPKSPACAHTDAHTNALQHKRRSGKNLCL